MQETVGAFNPEDTLNNLHNYPITTLCAPPTVYRQFVVPERQRHFASNPPRALESCAGAGEPLNAEVIRIWQRMSGLEIREAYGQTETTMVCGNFVGKTIKPGSMGVPLPGVPLNVIDNDGNEVAAHEEGDIAVATTTISPSARTMQLFDGYVDDTGKPVRRVRKDKSMREWYVTGDRAYKDGEGYLWFVGRSDDVINSSGYRIGMALPNLPWI